MTNCREELIYLCSIDDLSNFKYVYDVYVNSAEYNMEVIYNVFIQSIRSNSFNVFCFLTSRLNITVDDVELCCNNNRLNMLKYLVDIGVDTSFNNYVFRKNIEEIKKYEILDFLNHIKDERIDTIKSIRTNMIPIKDVFELIRERRIELIQQYVEEKRIIVSNNILNYCLKIMNFDIYNYFLTKRF